ncbi:MAG: PLP-dependent aminotransferase family protein [Chloroflexi bacterium]|nr:PLP-dependent aminotransferase family protein [Chloroflexota bacterium]
MTATTTRFSYEGLFSERSEDTPINTVPHAEYDFAVAYPAPETSPMDGLIGALQTAMDSRGDEIARHMAYYPQPAGSPELREYVAWKLEYDRGFKVDIDDILLTAGSGESIGLAIQALTNPGDTAITEHFVYSGTLGQLQRFGNTVYGAETDDEGLVPEAVDELITKLDAKGKKPKMIYTIAEHQNPMGPTLPVERREALLEIAHRHGVPILEDECYVDLRFEGEMQPAFRTLDDSGIVIHVASFSKLLAPGLRMGYITAAPEVLRRSMSCKVGSGPNQFASYAIEGFLRNSLDDHRARFNPLLKQKRDAMDQSLNDHFSDIGASWSRPEGGCYTWLTMPEGTDITSPRDEIFAEGVGYNGGVGFAPNGDGQNCARLCFAFETPEKCYDGIEKLAGLFGKRGLM